MEALVIMDGPVSTVATPFITVMRVAIAGSLTPPLPDRGAAVREWIRHVDTNIDTARLEACATGGIYLAPIFSMVVSAARDRLIAGISPNPRPEADTIPVSFS